MKTKITIMAKVTCQLSDTSIRTHITSPLFLVSTFTSRKIVKEELLYMSHQQRFFGRSPTFPAKEKFTNCLMNLLKIPLLIRLNKILVHHFFPKHRNCAMAFHLIIFVHTNQVLFARWDQRREGNLSSFRFWFTNGTCVYDCLLHALASYSHLMARTGPFICQRYHLSSITL